MRLRFHTEVTQAVVNADQRALRSATPRSYPIALVLGLSLGTAIALYAVWAWVTAGRVYSYGVVATGAEAFHAPIQSVVEEVRVEPGDRVRADQVLYVLTSESARAELQEANESLSQEQRVLEVAESQRATLFEDPVQELRDLTIARGQLQQQQLALATARAQRRDDADRRIAARDRAQRHVELASAIAQDRERRADAAARLAAADAATPDELARAQEAQARARLELADAEGERDRLAGEVERGGAADLDDLRGHEQALTLAQAYVNRLEQSYDEIKKLRVAEKERGIENIRSRIAGLDARIAHLRKLAGPTEVRALADGVVTEVMASAGSMVPRDGAVLTVSGTGKVWINAFVPPEAARDVRVGDPVSIYPTTGSGKLTGRITAGGGIQYRIPAALGDRMPAASAVYARVDLDTSGAELIPGNVVKLVIR